MVEDEGATVSELDGVVQGDPVLAGVDQIRAQFPALERTHGAHPVAYFDGPGGTQVPRAVVEASSEYLYRHNANTHWEYASSRETDDCLAAARGPLADLLGAGSDEIVFGANMTTLTFHVSRALAASWGPNDEIVVTQLDHQANQAPWRALESERGVTVRSVPMLLEDGTLDWQRLEELVGSRTRLLALGAASNALGTINDVTRASELARSVGALLFVDAVHFAPHAVTDVRAMGCDFLACSAYKFYGPHVGVMYIRKDLGDSLVPPRLPCSGSEMPERYETGTLNHEGLVGAGAAVDFLADLVDGVGDRRGRLEAALGGLHVRGQGLLETLWSGLSDLAGVRLYGPNPERPRTPTVAFTVEGLSSDQVAARLSDEWGVFVSHGDFYASGVTEALGLTASGLVRAGCACYTTEEEVRRLVEGVTALAG